MALLCLSWRSVVSNNAFVVLYIVHNSYKINSVRYKIYLRITLIQFYFFVIGVGDKFGGNSYFQNNFH